MPTKINAVFDLENKTITLSGLTPDPIIKYISDETNQIQYIEFVIDETFNVFANGYMLYILFLSLE